MGHEIDAEQLCDVLQAELDALKRLAHTLDVQGLILNSGRIDLLAESGRDVEDALGDVREVDLMRAITVSALHLHCSDVLPGPGDSAQAPSQAYPSLGQLADTMGGPVREVMRELGIGLRKTLAKVISIADENATRLETARGAVQVSEAALGSEDPWRPPRVDVSIDDFLEDISQASQPDALLSDVEGRIMEDESGPISIAVTDLALQAVTVTAALGVLQGVGCRPLVEFITDREDART